MKHKFFIQNCKTIVDYYVCEFDDELFEDYTGEKIPKEKNEEELAKWLRMRLNDWNKEANSRKLADSKTIYAQEKIEEVLESLSRKTESDCHLDDRFFVGVE